jgi:hypothetical protein
MLDMESKAIFIRDEIHLLCKKKNYYSFMTISERSWAWIQSDDFGYIALQFPENSNAHYDPYPVFSKFRGEFIKNSKSFLGYVIPKNEFIPLLKNGSIALSIPREIIAHIKNMRLFLEEEFLLFEMNVNSKKTDYLTKLASFLDNCFGLLYCVMPTGLRPRIKFNNITTSRTFPHYHLMLDKKMVENIIVNNFIVDLYCHIFGRDIPLSQMLFLYIEKNSDVFRTNYHLQKLEECLLPKKETFLSTIVKEILVDGKYLSPALAKKLYEFFPNIEHKEQDLSVKDFKKSLKEKTHSWEKDLGSLLINWLDKRSFLCDKKELSSFIELGDQKMAILSLDEALEMFAPLLCELRNRQDLVQSITLQALIAEK